MAEAPARLSAYYATEARELSDTATMDLAACRWGRQLRRTDLFRESHDPLLLGGHTQKFGTSRARNGH